MNHIDTLCLEKKLEWSLFERVNIQRGMDGVIDVV